MWGRECWLWISGMRHVGLLSLSQCGDLARLISKQGGFFGGLDTTKKFRQTGKMPVAGLPTALDNALESLLTENAVSTSQWKMSAEGTWGEPPLSFDSWRQLTQTWPISLTPTRPHNTFRRRLSARCDTTNAGPPNGQDRTQRQVNILLLVYFNQHHSQQQQ